MEPTSLKGTAAATATVTTVVASFVEGILADDTINNIYVTLPPVHIIQITLVTLKVAGDSLRDCD